MKPDSLLKLMISSEVRKELMFQLLEEPKPLTELKTYFGLSSPNIIPRIRELESKNLIIKGDGKYCLSHIGIILAKKGRMISNLSALLEENGRFLNEHDLTPIPDYLLCRMDELGKCTLIENGMNDFNAMRKVFEHIFESKHIFGVMPIYSSKHPEYFLSAARQKIPSSIILTDAVFEKMENEYSDTLQAYLMYDNARIYTIGDARLAFIVTDTLLSIFLHHNNGPLDIQACLTSHEQSAINWGIELFEYYKQKSKKLKASEYL